MMDLKYVLITSARNEEDFIGKTITSVINQTVSPEKWIIVNDGSTDKTEEAIQEYLSENNFIELISNNGEEERSFGSKAKAVMFAYEKLKHLNFDLIGNLDADISFEADYFEKILTRFEDNPKLGLAGGVRFDFCNGEFVKIPTHKNYVAGAYQTFRKKCFDEIGGYLPLKYGGIDAVAEASCRKFGWEVRSYDDCQLYHHRCTGSASGNTLKYRFRHGLKFYSIGYQPLFVTLKFIKEVFHKPVIVGSIVSIFAYYWALFFRFKKQVPKDFVKFLRAEQWKRMTLFNSAENISK